MVIFIFKFWKPESVCSPDGKEDGSVWEQTYCERPLFTTLHTLAAGPMSPVNSCYYTSTSLSYSSQKASVGCNSVAHFSQRLDFPPLLAAWLLWLSKTVHFSCLHHQWEPRCSAMRCGQVFERCLGSCALCFAHWRGRLDENKAAEARTSDSEREFLKLY